MPERSGFAAATAAERSGLSTSELCVCVCRGAGDREKAVVLHPDWALQLQDGAERTGAGDGVHRRGAVSGTRRRVPPRRHRHSA